MMIDPMNDETMNGDLTPDDAGTDELLERALRRAFAARAEPPASSNLAMRVVAHARSAQRQRAAAPDRRQRVVERIASWLALAALAAMLISGTARVLSIRAASDALESSAAMTSATLTSDGTSSEEIGTMLLVGCAALAGTCVYLALQNAFTIDEARLDFTIS